VVVFIAEFYLNLSVDIFDDLLLFKQITKIHVTSCLKFNEVCQHWSPFYRFRW